MESMDDETVAAVIQRHPGSEVFRDLLVAETEEELEALAKDLASRLGKVEPLTQRRSLHSVRPMRSVRTVM
jgi:hypothetical protein